MRTFLRFSMLCLASLLSMSVYAYDFKALNNEGVTIYYNITSQEKKTVEVTYEKWIFSYQSDQYTGVVIIPDKVEYSSVEYQVTSIGMRAFYACNTLTNITIPNSVKTIGSSAFYLCTGLSSITIPNSVTEIGYECFLGCHGLTSITIPNSVTKIGNDAFGTCPNITVEHEGLRYVDSYLIGTSDLSQSTYVIKEGTKWIGNKAFIYCSKLDNITIPNTVTSIGHSAFKDVSTLKSVIIGSSVSTIDESAFYGCSGLTTVNIPNSVKTIGEWAFDGCTSLPVENNIRYADTYLVEATDKSLSTYTIKEGTKWIGSGAFGDCSNLTSVVIPKTVSNICRLRLSGFEKLESIVVDPENEVFDSRENCNAIIEKSTNTLKTGCKNTTIPNSVTIIGEDAFLGCYEMKSIDIPNSVVRIGERAFDNCKDIESVHLGNSVKSIGNAAFNYCPKLTSINLPNSLDSIGDFAFENCSNLESICIPKSVKYLGNDLFLDCTKFFDVTVEWTDNIVIPNTRTFIGNDLSKATLHVPSGTKKLYEAASIWKDFGTIVEETLPHYDFDENSDITTQLEELVSEGKRVDLTINRTFYCDGYFNTICLPFSMTAAEIAASPIGGYKELKKFVKADVKGKGKEMNVNVGLSATKEIEAGVPYLISWHKGANIVNPTFENVLVTESVGKTISGGGMSYIGILTPTVLDPTGNNLLFLGENNLLYWSSDTTPLKAFRAYFSVNPVSMANFRKDMMAFFVDIDEVTGIDEVQDSRFNVQSAKYIENGKVVIVKNGVKYDTMGRIVK